MGFDPVEDYYESAWRESLYAVQMHLTPAVADKQEAEVERAPWTNIPRWMEDSQEAKLHTRILDIGSGRGVLLATARQILTGMPELVSIEADVDAISEATLKEFDIKCLAANIETVVDISSLKDCSLVIMTEVLQHLRYNPVMTLQRIHDIMAPGGYLLLSTPDAKTAGRTFLSRRSMSDCPLTGEDSSVSKQAQWIFTREEVEGCLVAAGFHIERFAYAGIGHCHFNFQCRR